MTKGHCQDLQKLLPWGFCFPSSESQIHLQSRLEMGSYSFSTAAWRDLYGPYHIVIRDVRDMSYEMLRTAVIC